MEGLPKVGDVISVIWDIICLTHSGEGIYVQPGQMCSEYCKIATIEIVKTIVYISES